MTATTLDSLDAPTRQTEGAVRAPVRVLLRLEGLALFAVSVLAFALVAHAEVGLFAACFLAPDLAFFGYLAGPRVGAACYNTTHATLAPMALLAVAITALPGALPFALIWIAHVGFDRMLGYGLKYGTRFQDTHLGVIGRPPRS